jgi:hypothetical protein
MRSSRLVRLLFLFATSLVASDTRPQQPFDLDIEFRTKINSWYVSGVAPLPDGDVLLSGQIRFPGDPIGTFRLLARVDHHGNQVSWFPYAYGGGKLTEWNGRYYVLNNQIVHRVWPDGTTDTDFIGMNLGPYFSSLQGGDYQVYPDGRILMSGVHELRDSIRGFEDLYCLIWFSNTGYLDTTKTHRTCAGSLDFFCELPNGQFIGSLGNPPNTASWEGQPTGSNVIRFNADGEWDPSFQANVWWGGAFGFLPLPDGRVYVAGNFRITGIPDTLNLVRFMPDGSLDPTFHNTARYRFFDPLYPSNPPMGYVGTVYPLSPGHLIVTGDFDHIDGVPRGSIALIDTSGNLLDDHFTGVGCGAYVYQATPFSTPFYYREIRSIIPAPDGSYYIWGAYHGYDDGTTNDTLQRMVSRLHGLNVGVQESVGLQSPVTVHPNPGGNHIWFSGLDGQGPVQVSVFDARGVLVLTGQTETDAPVQVGALASGLYTVAVQQDGTHRIRLKWVKQ